VNAGLVMVILASGGAAAAIRYLVSRTLPLGPGGLPLGVLVVNVAGALIGGVVLGLVERAAVGDDVRLVVLTGVCGGLTTFSTWSVETVELMLKGRWRAGLVGLAGNLVLGLGACTAGYLLAR